MQKPTSLVILPVIGIFITIFLSACTPTGDGMTSDGFSAPAPVSPVDRTENLRSQYRDQMR